MNFDPIGIPRVPAARTPLAPSRPTESNAAPASPAEAPSLADLLTPDEREFFARIESLGPLSYRPNAARRETPVVPTGQRIDVRG